ncbi:MAG TPA: hypothetical protein VGG89_04295 [Candidatus Baltobacteraceae bacterium]|jgi:hypothetical protein
MTLADLGFLVGTWSCVYNAGGQHATYTAVYAYDIQNNWIRARDAWQGGGGDVAYFTRDPKGGGWTYAAFESDRSTTVFRAKDDGATHIVYRSVYPNNGWTDVFDKVSPAKYTLHFSGVIGGKATTSFDVCTKH